MANIPNAPGMPVVPNAVDISRYNLWAARYGRPLWGANAAPAPPPPPPPHPAAPARRGWQKGKPRGAPPPAPHGEPSDAAAHPDDAWQRGTWEESRKTYARKKNGQPRVVCIWNSITRQYRVTPQGEDYYKHNRQDFIFEIPVISVQMKDGRPVERFRTYMNFTEEYIEAHCPNLESYNLHGIFGAGVVRDRLSGPAEVQAAITEAVQIFIANIESTTSRGVRC